MDAITRVAILAEHRGERTELRTLLHTAHDIAVVADFRSTAEAALAARRGAADVIVLSAWNDGHRTARSMRLLTSARRTRRPAVLVVTSERADTTRLLMLGAGAVLARTDGLDNVVPSVRLVAAGYVVAAPIAATSTPSARSLGWVDRGGGTATLQQLTPREMEVLKLVATGHSNAEISSRLSLSENTVKFHMQRLLTKLGLRNRASAVVFAYEAGLVKAGKSV